LLDLFAVPFTLQTLGHQGWQLGIGGEPQANELIFRQVGNSRLKVGGQQFLQSQALLQPDQAILDLERIQTDLESG
jgi:hypothetical protein